MDKMNQFMFGGAGGGNTGGVNEVKSLNHQYLDLDMLFTNFDTLCDEWDTNTSSRSLTLSAFSMSNRILNNRYFFLEFIFELINLILIF